MSTLPSSNAEAVITECLARSAAGALRFPEVVACLSAAKVAHYQIDLLRDLTTVYLVTGESLVIPLAVAPGEIAAEFDMAAVRAAIGAAQRDEIRYPEFIPRIRAAGTIGYFVYLTGRRAVYYGRSGDQHTEHFPPVV